MVLLDFAIATTNEYIAQMPKLMRKKYGQFFTSKETAVYMASLFQISATQSSVTILDPGSGTGILSLALLDRLQNLPEIQDIHLICYENDSNVLNILKTNLNFAVQHCTKNLKFTIYPTNYILDQKDHYAGKNITSATSFDFIISNPPYIKLPKDAPEAQAMPDICYGAPNIYFLFAEMSLFNLKNGGEMVYIIPRSWTSGAYFKKFREKFLKYGVLTNIHLFVSRDKVFDQENVLQETMIIKVKKTTISPENISITTTQNNANFEICSEFKAPYDIVVNNKTTYIYLITNQEELISLKRLNKYNYTLPEIGLKMKTGLTVDFRNRESLRNNAEKNAVPLFYAQHIQQGTVNFPIGKENEFLVTEQKGLLQNNSNYLFVKRFTTKEEHRRLQCGIYLASKYKNYSQISTQNKINFICGTKNLTKNTVYGLYTLFNSTIYDTYYRILNGSTQVNSTEVNTMPVPPLETINQLGCELISCKDLSESTCDRILENYL